MRLMLKSAPGEILGAEPSGIEESVEKLLSDDAGQAERPWTLLYSYTTTATNSPYVTGSVMETGYVPFQQQPVYIGYGPSGVGTMTIDT
jgi:hypothetical protein